MEIEKEAAFRRLVAVLVESQMTGVREGAVKEPELVAGRLPGDLGIDLPLSPHHCLVGSATSPDRKVVILATDETPVIALGRYRRAMAEIGYREIMAKDTGFTSVKAPTWPLLLQRGPLDPSVEIFAWARGDGSTQIRVTVRRKLGRSQGPVPFPVRMAFGGLPALDPPLGCWYEGGQSTQYKGRMALRTRVVSDHSTRELAEHYAHQLQAGGWQTGEIIDGEWSGGMMCRGHGDGKDWQGMFTLVRSDSEPPGCDLALILTSSSTVGAQIP